MLIFSTNSWFTALLLFWIVVSNATIAASFHGRLPDVSFISTLFNTFMKPYLNTLDYEPRSRDFDEAKTSVERVVKRKIKQLKPFLQDYDSDEAENDNEFTFKGNDETTIIEFVPQSGNASNKAKGNVNDTFKASMRRYKKVRNKINEALDAESVSEKTKTLIMQTLDELLSKMVETQCQWKGGTRELTNNIVNYDNQLIVPRSIVNMWKAEWQKFKTKFSSLTQLRSNDGLKYFSTLMSNFDRLNRIIDDFSFNLENIEKKYKIRCDIIERKDSNASDHNEAREKHNSLSFPYDSDIEKNACKNFKVCSKELKGFLLETYYSVNETAVNVLRSYAEMFTRDVNTDVSDEKSSIVGIIFDTANETEKHITVIFKNDTYKIYLDPDKRKEVNIRHLRKFVKNIIWHTKEDINNNLQGKLNHLHKKVSSSIQQDVATNLDVELGNLEKDLTSKICLIFNVCNNNAKTRKKYGNYFENAISDGNRIYVRVELTMDDSDTNAIGKGNSKIQKMTSKLNTEKMTEGFGRTRYFNTSTKLLNYDKYSNISVTRTTLMLQAA